MLRLWEKALLLGFLFTLVISMIDFSGKCDGINDKILRFHVIANSDSSEDQELKIKVRDKVLMYCSYFMESNMKKEDVREIIYRHKEEIEKVAEEEIKGNGYNYTARLEIASDVPFNTRNYGEVTMPAGNYEAVRLIIGEGSGKNWWCVMFPPMCLPAAEEKKELREVLNSDEINLIENDEYDKCYDVKFKTWEWFIDFKNFIVNIFSLHEKVRV